MDFKSHEEVVLTPDKAAKQREQDAARRRQSSPQVREIKIPAGEKKIKTASASAKSSDGESATPRVTKIQPKILNAGMKLLNVASERGSPGGRLIRSGQHARASDEIQTPTPPPPKPAPRKASATPKVKVESVGSMQFSEEDIAEVATLQAPPPVDPTPGTPVLEIASRKLVAESDAPEPKVTEREIALNILANPGDAESVIKFIPQHRSDAVEQPDLPEPKPKPKPKPKPEWLEIDSKKSVEQRDLPEPKPEPVKIDSKEFVESQDLQEPKPEIRPVTIDSKEFVESLNLPEPEPVKVEQRDLPEPEPVRIKQPAKPAKPAKKSKTKTGSSNQKPYRDFIIAYDGVFIGHFRSRKRILNRTAFQRVARQMRSTASSFDEAKLQLYRPVPIEVNDPDSLEISDGAFMWFGDGQPG